MYWNLSSALMYIVVYSWIVTLDVLKWVKIMLSTEKELVE